MNAYTFDEIAIGHKESFAVTVTEAMMTHFLKLTRDENPLHTDESFARQMGYPGKVVYGMLTASLFSTLAGVYLPGLHSLIHRVETEFPKPVFLGDRLTVSGVVKEKDTLFRTIEVRLMITNGDGEKVCRGKMRIGVLK